MKNTFEIKKHHETCGDKFFTLAITNQDGTHTDIWSEATLIEVLRRGKAITIDSENEELVNEVEQLGYITIAAEEGEFDIYFHKIFVAANEMVEIDFAGDFKKTYKTEKGAASFAAKQGYPVL
jgi:hypothetical protein